MQKGEEKEKQKERQPTLAALISGPVKIAKIVTGPNLYVCDLMAEVSSGDPTRPF